MNVIKNNGKSVNFGGRIPADLADVVKSYCKANGIKKQFFLEFALRGHLKGHGVHGSMMANRKRAN